MSESSTTWRSGVGSSSNGQINPFDLNSSMKFTMPSLFFSGSLHWVLSTCRVMLMLLGFPPHFSSISRCGSRVNGSSHHVFFCTVSTSTDWSMSNCSFSSLMDRARWKLLSLHLEQDWQSRHRKSSRLPASSSSFNCCIILPVVSFVTKISPSWGFTPSMSWVSSRWSLRTRTTLTLLDVQLGLVVSLLGCKGGFILGSQKSAFSFSRPDSSRVQDLSWVFDSTFTAVRGCDVQSIFSSSPETVSSSSIILSPILLHRACTLVLRTVETAIFWPGGVWYTFSCKLSVGRGKLFSKW